MPASNKDNNISLRGKIYIIRNMISVFLTGLIFFLAAGRWDIMRGWIYFILAICVILIANLVIGSKNPELLHQRFKIHTGSKNWDKWWLLIFALIFVYGMPLVAGWEIGRMGRQMSFWSLLLGLILYFLSVFISTWAMIVNQFFEPTVRIQKDRNHKVITKGPYGFIRHPGYFGIILWAIAFPLIVGSTFALYQGIILILFSAVRTYFEDKTLQLELEGYKSYTEKVRYRLFPGIW